MVDPFVDAGVRASRVTNSEAERAFKFGAAGLRARRAKKVRFTAPADPELRRPNI
jgi:hypothetical protein